MKLLLLSITSLFFISLPFAVVQAQPAGVDAQQQECEELRKKFENAGAGDLAKSLPAYCNEGEVFNRVTTVLYTITGSVAVIAIMYGGYVYMTARGNEQATKRGREILTYSILGLLVVVFAVTIITLVARFALTGGGIF